MGVRLPREKRPRRPLPGVRGHLRATRSTGQGAQRGAGAREPGIEGRPPRRRRPREPARRRFQPPGVLRPQLGRRLRARRGRGGGPLPDARPHEQGLGRGRPPRSQISTATGWTRSSARSPRTTPIVCKQMPCRGFHHHGGAARSFALLAHALALLPGTPSFRAAAPALPLSARETPSSVRAPGRVVFLPKLETVVSAFRCVRVWSRQGQLSLPRRMGC